MYPRNLVLLIGRRGARRRVRRARAHAHPSGRHRVAPARGRVAADGRYTLTLALPKDVYAAGEDITGLGTLSVEPGPDVVVSGSGPLGSPTRRSADGARWARLEGDCGRYNLTASSPLASEAHEVGQLGRRTARRGLLP